MTLLEETIEFLKTYGKTPEDVLWCGDEHHWFPWEVFEVYADFEYDSGFGGQEVAPDILVVGDGWWMERGEYDGSEWWEFKTLPKKPESMMPPVKLVGGLWSSMWEEY